MFDRLLKSLRGRLAVEEREWRSQNHLRNTLYLSRWRRAILFAATKPRRYLGWLSFLVFFLSMAAAILDPKLWTIFHVRNFSVPDRVDNFSALWSVQAAIAALVYPIVIAFVTLLVDRNSTTRATLHIYLHDSAALLAGLSALLLVGEMGLQYFMLSYANDSALALWLVLDSSWFALNMVLTIYFLYRTFEFMRPLQRYEITRRYAISVAWPQEARHHLAKHIFGSAILDHLLPGAAYGTQKGNSPSVLLGYTGLEDGAPSVRRQLGRRRRQLVDIRFRLLGWAISGWLEKSTKSQVAPRQDASWSAPSGAVISFPLDPFEIYKGDTTLCQVKDGASPSWLQRLMIRLSFKFAAPRHSVELSINDILLDFQAEAIAAIRSGEQDSFEDSVNRLLGLFESLVDASSVLDSSGDQSNLTLLPDRNHWFSRPIHEIWRRRIIDLFEAASRKLSVGEDYVSFLTRVPNRLFSRAQESAVSALLLDSVSMSPILLWRVQDWWTNMLEQQGQIDHGPCKEGTLRPPFFGIHDRVLRSFVGSWESLRDSIISSRGNAVDWRLTRQSADLLDAHLAHTLVMLMRSVTLGDVNSAEWLTDVLVRWYEQIRFRLEGSSHVFLRRQRLLTIDLISADWEVVKKRVQLESQGVPDTVAPHAILGACLNNLWIDTCCIALFELAVWGKPCDCTRSLPARIFASIAGGEPLRPGGDSHAHSNLFIGPDDLILAILRQRFADARYNARLDGYVDKIADLSRAEMVSGRIYSRSGSDDLDSLDEGCLLVLMLTLPANWSASREIIEILAGWSRTDSDRVRRIERMLANWKKILDQQSFSELAEQYECLRTKTGKGLPNAESKASLIRGIDRLLNEMNGAQALALAEAPISKDKLASISQWCSRTAFAVETAAFPVPLFHKVSSTADSRLDPFALVIKGIKRGELTDPPMADIAVNEDDWYSETLRGFVASTILGKSLRELKPKIIVANSPKAYWTQVKKYAAKAHEHGFHPILLLENPTIPEWVWEWGNSMYNLPIPGSPADLTVSRDKSIQVDGYQWTFNDIPVFDAPLIPGSSILLVRESLAEIEFTENSKNRFVTVSESTVDEHPELVDLRLEWKMRIRLIKHPSTRLTYSA